MTISLSLTLPAPPSTNRLHRFGNGRAYTPDTYTDWKWQAGVMAVSQAAGVTFPNRFGLTVYAPRANRKDLDNLLKALCDLCQATGIVTNDNRMDDVRVVRDWSADGTDVRVELVEMPDAPNKIRAPRKPKSR